MTRVKTVQENLNQSAPADFRFSGPLFDRNNIVIGQGSLMVGYYDSGSIMIVKIWLA